MSAIPQESGERETPADDSSRPKLRALLLQGEQLANRSLTQAIAEVGFVLLGPLTEASQAIEWIEKDCPDIVILDMAVSDGTFFELADELHRRNIPFLFYTSWHDSSVHRDDIENLSSIEEPLAFVLVVKLLSNMVEARREPSL